MKPCHKAKNREKKTKKETKNWFDCQEKTVQGQEQDGMEPKQRGPLFSTLAACQKNPDML